MLAYHLFYLFAAMPSTIGTPHIFGRRHRPQKSMPNAGTVARENSTTKRRLSSLARSFSARKAPPPTDAGAMNPSTSTPGTTTATGLVHVAIEEESFGNWPNSEGVCIFYIIPLILWTSFAGYGLHPSDTLKFDVFHEERTPIELRVTGSIPEYALYEYL